MHLISVEAVASTEKKALIIGHMPMINRAWMHIHIFFPQNWSRGPSLCYYYNDEGRKRHFNQDIISPAITPIEWHHGKGKVCCMASFWNIRQTEKPTHDSVQVNKPTGWSRERTLLLHTARLSLSLHAFVTCGFRSRDQRVSPQEKQQRVSAQEKQGVSPQEKLGTPSSWSTSFCLLHHAWRMDSIQQEQVMFVCG
jgi:hypothetical protein